MVQAPWLRIIFSFAARTLPRMNSSKPAQPAARTAAPARAPGAPRYQRVADALIAEIEQGRYKVGDMLPPELEIAERFGISRYTAREAIRRLTELGLITRRAGIGTTVTRTSAQANYTARISDIGELVHYAQQTRLKLLTEDNVKVEGPLAEVVPQALGQTWMRIVALRYREGSGKPIEHTTILVDPAFTRIRERIREKGAAVYRLLDEMYGEQIAEVRQEISCTALPEAQAALLGEPVGTPVLLVYRYYLGQSGNLLSMSINLSPPDRFRLATSWRLGYS